jgi:putative ABC transport system permease protein
MARLLQDIRYGVRMLAKNPGFTIVAVLTLAMGIGANTAIFSVVQGVLLRPLPFDRPGQLVEVKNTYEPIVPEAGLSPGDFADWCRQAVSFSASGGYSELSREFNLTGDGEPERITTGHATSSLFPVLGIRAVAGRTFLPEEDKLGSAPVVMLSHVFWQSHYGGAPGVVGRTISLDGQRYSVVGILPATFQLIRQDQVWMPFGLYPDNLAEHVHHGVVLVGRLKAGVTLRQAQAEMETLNKQEAAIYPVEHKGFGVRVKPLEAPGAAALRRTLLVLFGAVGFVLLVACANIANLLLARNAARDREIAVRSALGASKRHLIQQMLTEALLISIGGGIMGLVSAVFVLKALVSLAPAQLVSLRSVRLDLPVLAFTAAVCIFAGLVCGILPAMQVLNRSLSGVLNQGSKGAAGLGGHRVHNFLVASEIALALIPLIGAGLLTRSFQRLLAVSPGFQREHVLAVEIPQAALSFAQQNQLTDAQAFELQRKQASEFESIVAQVRALPGVSSVGGIDLMPLDSQEHQASRFVIEGQPPPDTGARPIVEFRSASLDYFSTLRIPLIRGRLFTPDDWSTPNILINEQMARRYWPDSDPLGKRINLCSLDPKPCWSQIVGVVGNVHQFGLDKPPTYDVYFAGGWKQYLIVRAVSDPAPMAAAVKDAIQRADPNLPVTKTSTLDALVSDSLSPRRFSAVLIGVFAALALLLSGAGIYGVMSYAVEQRTREIGVRMALGAQPRAILGLIVGRGARLALVGIVVGAVGALALTRVLASLLYGVRPTDPLTFAGVALLLASVALFACYVPARRAMRVDPMIVLRYE